MKKTTKRRLPGQNRKNNRAIISEENPMMKKRLACNRPANVPSEVASIAEFAFNWRQAFDRLAKPGQQPQIKDLDAHKQNMEIMRRRTWVLLCDVIQSWNYSAVFDLAREMKRLETAKERVKDWAMIYLASANQKQAEQRREGKKVQPLNIAALKSQADKAGVRPTQSLKTWRRRAREMKVERNTIGRPKKGQIRNQL